MNKPHPESELHQELFAFEGLLQKRPRLTYGKTDNKNYWSELHQFAVDSQKWSKEVSERWQLLKPKLLEGSV